LPCEVKYVKHKTAWTEIHHSKELKAGYDSFMKARRFPVPKPENKAWEQEKQERKRYLLRGQIFIIADSAAGQTAVCFFEGIFFREHLIYLNKRRDPLFHRQFGHLCSRALYNPVNRHEINFFVLFNSGFFFFMVFFQPFAVIDDSICYFFGDSY
jgi:hypothetical protein